MRGRLASPAHAGVREPLGPPASTSPTLIEPRRRGRAGTGRRIRPGYDASSTSWSRRSPTRAAGSPSSSARERERTGIKSLKVGYNKVFGYYLEVTHANLRACRADYQRKQTLVSAERYVTPELKEYEARIRRRRGADRRAGGGALFAALLRADRRARRPRCSRTAGALAHARRPRRAGRGRGRARLRAGPTLDDGDALAHRGRAPPGRRGGARAPAALRAERLPTSTPTARRSSILTGPNMAGKSTYLRQVALIVLLAQIGSVRPGRPRRGSGVVDRIFTRVGAQDDLAAGAEHLHGRDDRDGQRSCATPRRAAWSSSTRSGAAPAPSTASRSPARWSSTSTTARRRARRSSRPTTTSWPRWPTRCRACATFNVDVREEGGEVVFLHRVVPGGGRPQLRHPRRPAGRPAGQRDAPRRGDPAPSSSGRREPANHDDLLAELLQPSTPARLSPIEALNWLWNIDAAVRRWT